VSARQVEGEFGVWSSECGKCEAETDKPSSEAPGIFALTTHLLTYSPLTTHPSIPSIPLLH